MGYYIIVQKGIDNTGVWVGLTILILWCLCLLLGLNTELRWSNPWVYVLLLLQTHLYTGLFITAHDAMHRLVSPNAKVNNALGWITAGLFAFNSFGRLNRKHHLHHGHPVTDEDPDYYEGSFLPWYVSFVRQYITLWQILLMAVTYNLLKLAYPMENLIVFWMAPAILSTFQLFYFGTYLPHRGEHEVGNLHRARSQAPNHLWGFVSCYFFGYHYEHHAKPWVPWYKLPAARAQSAEKG